MEKSFSEIISSSKLNQLVIWRRRYSEKEYPYKVALNLLYDLLVVEKMWDEIQSSFKISHLGRGKNKFQNFNEAHGYILARCDMIAQNNVQPKVELEYKYRDSIAKLSWDSIRNRVINAQSGDNNEVQEIELNYYLFTSGVELIYVWGAFGYLGTDRESAFKELTGLAVENIDFSSYQSLINGFAKTSANYYKPLPNLFRNINISKNLNVHSNIPTAENIGSPQTL